MQHLSLGLFSRDVDVHSLIDLHRQDAHGGHLLSLKQDVYGHRQFLISSLESS